jgi:hypothetical protein
MEAGFALIVVGLIAIGAVVVFAWNNSGAERGSGSDSPWIGGDGGGGGWGDGGGHDGGGGGGDGGGGGGGGD